MDKIKLYKFYGVLKSDILTLIETTPKELHKTLKKAHGIESLRDITAKELYNFIISIQAHFASEYGVELPLKYQGMTLSEYLNQSDYEHS